MKSYKLGASLGFAAIGLVLFAAGLVLIKVYPQASGFLQVLPYLCIGIGAGVFGHNLGSAITAHLYKKDKYAAKQAEIEEKDERNITLRNAAKGKAYDFMIFVYGALCIAFACMGVEVFLVLVLVAAYLAVVFSNVYFLIKFQKEM